MAKGVKDTVMVMMILVIIMITMKQDTKKDMKKDMKKANPGMRMSKKMIGKQLVWHNICLSHYSIN